MKNRPPNWMFAFIILDTGACLIGALHACVHNDSMDLPLVRTGNYSGLAMWYLEIHDRKNSQRQSSDGIYFEGEVLKRRGHVLQYEDDEANSLLTWYTEMSAS